MKLLLKIIIPLLILLAAFGIFKWLGTLKPPVQSKLPDKGDPDAEYIEVSPADHSPPVLSFGTVQPHFETVLTPQVSGRIHKVTKKFRVGRVVNKGDVLCKIDATDYRAVLAREQANLATAQRTLAEEKARAKQAAEDWVASGRKLTDASEFVLRKPQVDAAESSIDSAQAAVDKANADIARTKVKAPYDAIITERSASKGNLANPQSVLGRLVAIERVELRLPLTAEQAVRVSLPMPGEATDRTIKAILSSPKHPGVKWTGKIVRTEPTVDPRNQVTYAIAEVMHPYAADSPVLAVGTFVNASISANAIEGSLRIPESALINDAWVWALSAENKLMRLHAVREYSLGGELFIRLKEDSAEQDRVEFPVRIVVRPLTNFREEMEVDPVRIGE